jgi:acyl carrier protein
MTLLRVALATMLVATALASTVSAQDRAAIEQRLRAELASLLKKNAAQLPVDKPVTGLGADELTVVEWQMAAERTFRVNISDDKLFDPKSKAVRNALTISSMAGIVATSPPWPKGKTK